MQNTSHNIEKLGFDKWFLDNVNSESQEEFAIARVTAIHKDSYMINNNEKDVFAELIGKIIYSADSLIDYPAVGDLVLANNLYQSDSFTGIG